ncbi:MAG: cytochrome c biogenesis protein CcsA [Campylobacterales bacterium]
MLKKMLTVYELIVSMRTVLVLMILLAFGSAAATFIENDFGNDSARALVYNHWWFEGVMFLLAIGLVGNMVRFKMWQKEKMPIFIFHASFLLILFGAFVTRHFGYEGTMNIREGKSSNVILSQRAHIKASSSGLHASWPVLLTPLTDNDFSFSANLGGGAPLTIEHKAFYANAGEAIVPDAKNGKPYVSVMVSAGNSEPISVDLFENEYVDLGAGILGFGNELNFERPAIVIGYDQDQLTVRAHSDLTRLDMDTREQAGLRAHSVHPLDRRKLYTTLEGINLVLKEHMTAASKKVVPVEQKTGVSAVIVEVSHKGESKELALMGGAGMGGVERQVELAGRVFNIAYGSQVIELPFALHLDKFIIDRYPGSNSPSSYESQVTIVDEEFGLKEPYRIYMNHILMHRGYRFYQSSFDRDEKGTILSVAKDPGMWPTYLGYALLTVGFFIAFFSPKSRFRKLATLLEKDRRQHFAPLLLAAFLALGIAQQPLAAEENATAQSGVLGIVTQAHADRFGTLLVQDSQGRIKPIDTLASEVLNKVARQSDIRGLSASQVFLGMISAPKGWQQVKMIRLGHPEIAAMIGLEPGAKEAALVDFFELNASEGVNPYKLSEAVNEAMRTPQSEQSKLQKELLKADERANIAYMVFQGHLLRIIPVRNDPNYTWVSPVQMLEMLEPAEAKEAAGLLYEYLYALRDAQISNEWSKADAALEKLRGYQRFYGAAVLPSQNRIEAEKLLNRLNPFERLMPYYFVAGLLFLGFAFYQVFRPAQNKTRLLISRGFYGAIALMFAAHTFSLALRWYVSGHAPWSNGYESMIYIAWATVLAGLIFSKHSLFALPATTILAGFGLMVAHLSWMDPQITTLVPVLKSYWLTIHVSVISASYGFLALSALLGFLALILFALRKPGSGGDYAILEMTRINEMAMMVGLGLLTVGNLFGAIWANESWGRYWSWDPKETWTLITMLVYALILHLRFIPHLKSAYTFALSSLVAYGSVLMTYFGVNYYLTGLHSYAGGDPMPVPSWLPVTVIVIALLGAAAWRGRDDKISLRS